MCHISFESNSQNSLFLNLFPTRHYTILYDCFKWLAKYLVGHRRAVFFELGYYSKVHKHQLSTSNVICLYLCNFSYSMCVSGGTIGNFKFNYSCSFIVIYVFRCLVLYLLELWVNRILYRFQLNYQQPS